MIIDQFLSSSEDKWNRISGLVLFLPHGYEGQGPEHSSARLERFLQLCAEDNMQVCNFSSSGQMFHALRRQMVRKWRKPLVIMTPEELAADAQLVHPTVRAGRGSSFQRLIPDTTGQRRRRHARDGLLPARSTTTSTRGAHEDKRGDVAILRVEQLYPFPEAALVKATAALPQPRRGLLGARGAAATWAHGSFVRDRIGAGAR